MIVFVEEKHLEKCHDENDGCFVAISSELLNYADWMADASMLIPPPDAVLHYLNTGDKENLRTEYYNYLSDPRISLILGLRIFQADKENVFFCYSKMEKEMGYPKFLREFITDHLNTPKYFVEKYKNFDGEIHKLKKKHYMNLIEFVNKMKKKCGEALSVLE